MSKQAVLLYLYSTVSSHLFSCLTNFIPSFPYKIFDHLIIRVYHPKLIDHPHIHLLRFPIAYPHTYTHSLFLLIPSPFSHFHSFAYTVSLLSVLLGHFSTLQLIDLTLLFIHVSEGVGLKIPNYCLLNKRIIL